jgi:hypothetical protein
MHAEPQPLAILEKVSTLIVTAAPIVENRSPNP